MSTVVLFMNGVTGEPYDCFKRLVPLTLTGAQVKELIVEVDSREPSCYNLLHSVGNVPISMDTTLDSQGVTPASYLKTVPIVFGTMVPMHQ